jgi:hypothetical protein
MFQKKFLERIKHAFYIQILLFKKIIAFYETTWKNIVDPDRPQLTTWHMHIACWIPEPTNSHSEYVKYIPFPLQQ